MADNRGFELTACVLAGDDIEAALSTAASVRAAGAVVLATPRPLAEATRQAMCGAFGPDAVQVIEIDLHDTVSQVWNALLRTASSDVCLLLHAGEILVAGRPGPAEAFGAATVVEQVDVATPPERLTNVRVVDRRRCSFAGPLRPVLQADAAPGETGSTVVVDLGASGGPSTAAWLQFSARHLDATHDAATLVDLAAMLAASGEDDAATVRLWQLLGALDGEQGRRAARLLAHTASRRSRWHEADLATAQWRRLTEQTGGGPARALHGIVLLAARRPGEALPELAAGLAAGLVDDDGIGLDRAWVESALSDAKIWTSRSSAMLNHALSSQEEQSLAGLIDLWCQSGRPLAALLDAFTGSRRKDVVAGALKLAAVLGPHRCLELAAWLWRSDKDGAATLVQQAASGGAIDLDLAVEWSRRLRTAGRAAACPLPLLAAGVATPPVHRVLAAAALIHDLRDERGQALLRAAVLDLHPAALDGTMNQIRLRTPELERMVELAG